MISASARPSTSLAPRIMILGGGFAGVTTALVGMSRVEHVDENIAAARVAPLD